MGPMLLHLREKMRKQGSRIDEGWSHWVEKISPSHGDNLADGDQRLGRGYDFADFYCRYFGRLQRLSKRSGIGRGD
jgi:hypothetical protein